MTDSKLTARQRRHDRTWQAIHDTAHELVQDKGMRATTVDEIAEKAGISPRAFFNYFPTKDDAVLGLRTPQLTDAMLERDAARGDRYVFVRITLLMLDILESSTSERTRDIVIKLSPEYPELKMRVKRLQMETEKILSEFLLRVDWDAFSAQNRKGDFSFHPEGFEAPEITQQKVRASVFVAFAALRYIAKDGAIPPLDVREPLIEEAVRLFQDLLRED